MGFSSILCEEFDKTQPEVSKEALMKPARTDGRRFCLSRKVWKRGNSFCISRFQNGTDVAKDAPSAADD